MDEAAAFVEGFAKSWAAPTVVGIEMALRPRAWRELAGAGFRPEFRRFR